jgi:hypothetical protein
VSVVSRWLVCVAAVLAVAGQASDQSVQLQYGSSAAPLESPPGDTVRERFTIAFDRRVDEQFADHFHPFNVMRWTTESVDREADFLNQRATSAARNAFSTSAVYGLREATVDLPLLLWFEERQGIVADFFRRSLGNVGEEVVAPLDPSYRPAEQSWWKRVAERNEVRYGIRPFTTSPYAFLSFALKEGDTLSLLGHVRYHYLSFAEHRFDLALSVPLGRGLGFDLGTSYQFGRHGHQEGLVLRLLKEFKSGGVLHVGMDAREHPAMFAGIALPW